MSCRATKEHPQQIQVVCQIRQPHDHSKVIDCMRTENNIAPDTAFTICQIEYLVPAQYGFTEFEAGSYKCNIFVAHRAEQAGADVPAISGIPARYPPLANEWAGAEDTNPYIPGFQTGIANWTLLTTPLHPQPGMIVAHPVAGGQGHVGIVDYDGYGIAVGVRYGTVNKQATEILDGTCGYRRYEP